ncbi:MAG: hypothetical protein IJ785_06950 [Bacteroidales bacterium]|nr:hypothetical protein [Bacteroidales bacterium]
MWHKIINNWKYIVVGITIVLTPILLNFILLLQIGIPEQLIVGDSKSWLSFWGTYTGSIGTILMVFITYKTLKQNNEQLDELKRQWEDEHRPRINISIAIYRKALFIKIKNIGVGNATNIKLSFNKDFIMKLPKENYKELYTNVEKRPFSIEPGGAKYIIIGFCEDIQKDWENKNVVLNIVGEYCSKYTINETFCMEDFITQRFVVVKDALSEIADGLSCPNSNHYPIQQSLDIIAKHTS